MTVGFVVHVVDEFHLMTYVSPFVRVLAAHPLQVTGVFGPSSHELEPNEQVHTVPGVPEVLYISTTAGDEPLLTPSTSHPQVILPTVTSPFGGIYPGFQLMSA
jgi:hypothetical protein